MQAVLNSVFPVFALIATGYVCARRGILGEAATDSLNRFVVWLALPALLFEAMANITWRQLDHPGFVAAFGGAMAATFLVSLLLGGRERRLADRGILGLDAAYANAGFMGIPLCLAALGRDALVPAIIAVILTACVLFAAAIVLIEMDLGEQPGLGASLGKVGRSLARNPLLISPVLGLLAAAVLHGALPGPIVRFVTLLAGAASPCALVAIGLFLAQSQAADEGMLIARLVALKLLVQPGLTWVLAYRVFVMPPLWAEVALLISALPIGTGPFMLAKLYDREAAVTSRAILVSTLLSVATVSALVAWLG